MEFFEFANVTEMFVSMYYNESDPMRVIWLSLLIGGLCFALVYVFEAVALYTIAKKGGFKNGWMAFVPFLNTYYIGVLANKNKIYKFDAKTVSAVLAVMEFIYVALSALYYIALSMIFSGGYAKPVYEDLNYGGTIISVITGYKPFNLPEGLNWAWWVFAHLQDYILSWYSLLYLVVNVFVLMSFFQTYACRRYWMFTLFSILFPVKGILFFAVRNNSGKNYRDYLREQQQRQYRMYQEYNRQSGNPYNYNPYSNNRPPQDPYTPPPSQGASGDPFGDFGSDSGQSGGGTQSGGDPFDDFDK